MKKTIFLITALLIVAVFVIAGCGEPAPTPTPAPTPEPGPAPEPAEPEVIEWRAQINIGKGTPDYERFAEGAQGFCSLVKEASGGQLIVKPYATGELMPDPETFEGVGANTIEVAHMAAAYWGGKIPAANLIGWLPYVIEGTDSTLYVHRTGAFELLAEEYEKHNVHLGYCLDIGESAIFSKKPAYTLEDYEGMKIRAIGICGSALEKIGASVVMVPLPELYASLETGVVDAGYYGSAFTGWQMRLYEVTDYILMPPAGTVMKEIIVSKKAYDALPDNLKAVVDQAVRCDLLNFSQHLHYGDVTAISEMLSAGQIKEVTTLPPEDIAELKKLSLEAIGEYAAGDPTANKMYQLLADYVKLIEG